MSPVSLALGYLMGAALALVVGLAVLAWIPSGRWGALQRWALAPAVGWSVLSLVCGTMVLHGPAVHVWALPVGAVLAALALGSVFLARRHLMPASPLESSRWRQMQAVFLGVGLAWLALASLGGPNFNLFRGNKWDRFNYDALALSMDHYRPDEIRQTDLKVLAAQDPAYVLVKENLIEDRIGVGGTLAFFSRLGGLRPSDFGYYFAMLGLVLSLPALLWLAWSNGASFGWALVLAAAASTGFWARFLMDVDVLGQCQAMPMAALFGVGLVLLPRPVGVLALGLSAAALMGTYPLYLPLLAGASVLWVLLRFWRGRRARLGLGGAALAALATALVLGLGVLGEALRQLTRQGKWVAATSVDWEKYHYPWLVNPPSPWRWIVGFWGLQPADHYWGLYWGLGWGMTALIVAAAWALARRRSRASAAASLCLLATGLGLALMLALQGRSYTACRGLAYVYAFAIVSLPSGWNAMQGRWRSAFKTVVLAWALVQFASGLKAFKQAAKGESGVASFLWQQREVDYRWGSLEEAVRRLNPPLLALDIEKPWVLERAEQVFGDRPWWTPEPLPSYHEQGVRKDGLRMPDPLQAPDLVLIEKERLPASLRGKPLLAETTELALLPWADLKAARAEGQR